MTTPAPPASVLSAILVANPDDTTGAMSVAVFSQSGETPGLPSLINDVVAMPVDALLDSSGTWTGFLATLGLTGATAPARWVGATASGAPTTGTFAVGDFVVSADGNCYVCVSAGSPGSWVASGGTPSNIHLATQSVNSAATLGATSAPVVLTDTTTAAFTLTLPAAPASNSMFILVDDTGQWAAHNLTVARNGKNIDGAASNLTLSTQWGKWWLYYDGTQWWTLASGASTGTSLPLTTLGDILYENATPAAARLAGNTTTTKKFLTQTGTGTVSAAPGWNTIAAGDLPFTLPLSRANGGTGVNTTPAAPVQYAPADPAATASTTTVMMGLGATCAYTPASSGKVKITVTGTTLTNTSGVPITLGGRFGTGTAPANGAADTGTRFGSGADRSIRAANNVTGVPFAVDAVISLTAGTAYWFDIALATQTAADTAQVNTVGVSIFEIS